MDVHTIRLRGPWQYAVVSPDHGDQPEEARTWQTVRLPATWADLSEFDSSARIRLRRRFHKPTGVEPHEMVFLVVTINGQHVDLCLNNTPLVPTGSGHAEEFRITEHLAETNELSVAFDRPATPDEQPILAAQLEIRFGST